MSRRFLSRRLLGWLPESLRLELIRRKIRICHAWPSPALEIKIAQTEEELTTAYRLLHDSYVDAKFMDPHPSGMRVLPQHMLPQTTTIVAKWDGEVVATISVIRDNPLGLPMDKIFDLSSRRRGGKRLAECSSLAVDPRFRGRSSIALFPLLRFAYQYARRSFGVHEFVLAVNPSTVDMQLAFMCSEKLEESAKAYDFVKGAPAVGFFLDFDEVERHWHQVFAHRPAHSNFHRYWTEIPSDPRNCLPQSQLSSAADPILTPELLKNFFLEKAQLKNTLTFFEMQTLLNAYPYQSFQDVVNSTLKSRSRNHVRLDVQMSAESPDRSVREVWNVSKSGLLLTAKRGALSVGQNTDVVVKVNDVQSIKLHCKVCWTTLSGMCGLQILVPNVQWHEMISALESPYLQLAQQFREAA